MNSDISWQVLLDKSKFQRILQPGSTKMPGLMCTSKYMACQQHCQHSRDWMNTSWRNPMNSRIFLIAAMLTRNLCLSTGTISWIISKKSSSSKLSGQTRWLLPSKTGLLNKWEKDSSSPQLLILLNATKIPAFKPPLFSCFLLVLILLLISSDSPNSPVWVRESSLFHWVKVKERKLLLW